MASSTRITTSNTLVARVLLLCLLGAAGRAHAALEVFLFASSTCDECRELKTQFLPLVKQEFGERITIVHVDIDAEGNFELLLKYEDHYGVQTDESLKLFVGDAVLAGRKMIEDRLTQVIAAQLTAGNSTFSPARDTTAEGVPTAESVKLGQPGSRGGTKTVDQADGTSSAKLVRRRFRQAGAGTLIMAGLIDGINPCAFTTIVFFVSLLATLKRSSREILLVGITFSLAVFASYLALGVGAFHALKALSVATGLSRALTWTVGVFALVLAVLSFRDAFVYGRTGRAEDVSLRLPHAFRLKITRLISRGLRTRSLIWGAAFLGIAVSALESVCTGQLYLPMIVLLLRDPAMKLRAFFWLLIYNLMFIIPLLTVLALTYCGLTSERLLGFSKRHVAVTKCLLGLLFLLMGMLILADLQ